MGLVLCLSHWPNEEDLDRNIVDIFSDRIQTNRQFGRDNFFLPSTWFQVETMCAQGKKLMKLASK